MISYSFNPKNLFRFLQLIALLSLSVASKSQKLDELKSVVFSSGTGTFQNSVTDQVASDHGRSLYTTGTYYSINVSGGIAIQNGPAYGFVAKLDDKGKVLWKWTNTTNQTGAGSGFFPRAITKDHNQNILVVGELNAGTGSITFGKKTYTYNASTGEHMGGIILKFDSTGTLLWQKNSVWYSKFNDVDVDAAGNIYLMGNSRTLTKVDTFTVKPSGSNRWRDFIVKISPSGTTQWLRQLGEINLTKSTFWNYGGQIKIQVEKRKNPRIYTAGLFYSDYSFGKQSFTAKGGEDALLLKFDHNGKYLGSLHEGGSTKDAFQDISLSANGTLALAFTCRDSTVFNKKAIVTPGKNYYSYCALIDTTLNHKWLKAVYNTGNPVELFADHYGRVAYSVPVLTPASSSTFDFLFLFNENGKLLFKKEATVPRTVQFAGLISRGPEIPRDRPDKLLFMGSYKPNLTIDKSLVTAGNSNGLDVGFVRLSIPNPCKIKFKLGPDDGYCGSVSHVLKVDSTLPYTRFEWWNGDTISKAQKISKSGKYWLKLSNDFCTVTDTVEIFSDKQRPNSILSVDTTFCDAVIYEPSLSDTTFRAFKWLDGTKKLNRKILEPGEFILSISNYCGSTHDTLKLRKVTTPKLSALADTFMCNGDSLELSLPSGMGAYQWSGAYSDTLPSIKVAAHGRYKVSLANSCGVDTSSFRLQALKTPHELKLRDTFFCSGGSVVLTPLTQRASFYWDDQLSPTQGLQVKERGVYRLKAVNGCGSASGFFRVSEVPQPKLSLSSSASSFCAGDSVRVLAASLQRPVYWPTRIDTAVGSLIYAKKGGNMIAYVENACGKAYDSVEIAELPLPKIELGKDTMLKTGASLTLSPNFIGDKIKWSNGADSRSITITKPGVYWAEATNSCGKARDSIQIGLFTGVLQSSEGALSIFPNPSNGLLTIEDVESGSLIELVHIRGEKVWEYQHRGGKQTLSFDLRDLSIGLYMIRLTNSSSIRLGRWVFQR